MIASRAPYLRLYLKHNHIVSSLKNSPRYVAISYTCRSSPNLSCRLRISRRKDYTPNLRLRIRPHNCPFGLFDGCAPTTRAFVGSIFWRLCAHIANDPKRCTILFCYNLSSFLRRFIKDFGRTRGVWGEMRCRKNGGDCRTCRRIGDISIFNIRPYNVAPLGAIVIHSDED